ncbi:ABC-2 type transport system ATP-binding protein [Gordonia amarae]|nr:ABC transporter ATP-binding protein [Gordonia amarae]MCS3878823.1 ABC-2 type transport system ATP-binding protein [Gordonia amarae]
MGAVIRTVGLSKTFHPRNQDPVYALRGADLTIDPGEIVAVLGPNGAGKTTLIDLILSLSTPTSGSVEVFGTSPREAIRDQRVGAVMQAGGLLPDMTVEHTVAMLAATMSDPPALDDVLARTDLTRLRHRRVGSCSGGEQQRVRFAIALLARPDLLILDEPTAGMDAGARRRFWATMREEADAGRTVLFATHYLAEAQQFAQRIVLLDGGRIIADDTPAGIQSRLSGCVVDYDITENGVRVHHTVTADDSDALARELLTTTDARNLRIAAHTLEDAFIALTDRDSHVVEGDRP